MSNTSEFIPKSILITGASSGIGASLALHYAAPSVILFLSGRDGARLAAIAAQCEQAGAVVHSAVISVADRAAMKTWIEAVDANPPLDLVIANAGISGGTGGAPEGESSDQAQEIFDINLQGVLNTLHPIIPRMIARKAGQIAVMGSLASLRGFPGAPAYSASKGAVRFYGEAMRAPLARHGVKMNVILPGFVESRITDQNNFPMPFIMTGEKAARIIASGLARNKSRIAFPSVLYILAGLIGLLPDWLAQKMLPRLPEKRSTEVKK